MDEHSAGNAPQPKQREDRLTDVARTRGPLQFTTTEILGLLNSDVATRAVDILPKRGKSEAAHPDTACEQIAVAFAVLLRRMGLAVPVSTVVAYTEALAAVGLTELGPVYWAGRAVFLHRPEDTGLYDRAFRTFWLGVLGRQSTVNNIVEHVPVALDADEDEDDDADNDMLDDPEPGADDMLAVRFSAVEVLRHKDFAEYTPEEFDEARAAMSRLRFTGSPRRSRRLRRVVGGRRTSRPDLRRTVRAALRTEGVPIRRRYLDVSEKPRRIVLLCDVSGSMESYARALVQFCQAAVVGRGRVEAFALGTRLTRITRELSSRDPDEALRRAASRVLDWSGGTRLGEGLRQFNDEWGVRGMARGAIVVILSDGWDRGDPEQLRTQMERLHRVAYQLIWVNPLKAAPGYAPLARGMAAALPHLDAFIEGHSLDSIAALADLLAHDGGASFSTIRSR